MRCASPQRLVYLSIAPLIAVVAALAVSSIESYSEAVRKAENETLCVGHCTKRKYMQKPPMRRQCLSLCESSRIFRNGRFCMETCVANDRKYFEKDCTETCRHLGRFSLIPDNVLVMTFVEVNGSFLLWDSSDYNVFYTLLYAVSNQSIWHPLFGLDGKSMNLDELVDNGYLKCNTSYFFRVGPFHRQGHRGQYVTTKDPYRKKCLKTWKTRCRSKADCIPDRCRRRDFSHSMRVVDAIDDTRSQSAFEWDDDDCSDVRARRRIAWNVARSEDVCWMLHAKAKANCFNFSDRWYPVPQNVTEFWLDDLRPGCILTVEMHALVENETFVLHRKDDDSAVTTLQVPHTGSARCNRFSYSLKFLESRIQRGLVPLEIKFKIRRDMVLRIGDGLSSSETTVRTTENLHWSWQPLCTRITVTFSVRDLTKRLLLIKEDVKNSTCPPAKATSPAEVDPTKETGIASYSSTQASDGYTAKTPTKPENDRAFDDAPSVDFPLAIVVSVAVSVLVVALIVTVAFSYAVTYVRRAKRRYAMASETRMQLSNYRPPIVALPSSLEPPDEWEIESRDLRLLDVMGEGFFGVVLRGEVTHGSETPPMTQKRLDMSTRRDPSRRRRSSSLRKIRTLVACKMLKENGTYEDQLELLEEIKLMKRIGQHEHIVSMIGCITRSHPVCLIMEYCSHGDLYNYLIKGRGRWSEKRKQSIACDSKAHMRRPTHPYVNVPGKGKKDEVEFTSLDLLSFAWQIASGMEYLSAKGLVHRDLACRNVLVVADKLLKVSDFGLARAVHQDGVYPQKTTRRLPLRWMSVEAIADRVFTERSDVWSFGVVMWEICTLGSFPYSAVSTKDLPSHLLAGERLPRPANCSEELYDMMSKCWCAEPERRPAFGVLAEALGKVLEVKKPTMYLQLDFSSSCELWDLASPESGEMSPDADAGRDAIVSSAATINNEVPESHESNDDDDS